MPRTALLFGGGTALEVSAASLKVGDLVLVRPGDRVSADGEVVEGESEVDESPVTGESVPVPKVEGASVVTGCVNVSGALRVRFIWLVVTTGMPSCHAEYRAADVLLAPFWPLMAMVNAHQAGRRTGQPFGYGRLSCVCMSGLASCLPETFEGCASTAPGTACRFSAPRRQLRAPDEKAAVHGSVDEVAFGNFVSLHDPLASPRHC